MCTTNEGGTAPPRAPTRPLPQPPLPLHKRSSVVRPLASKPAPPFSLCSSPVRATASMPLPVFSAPVSVRAAEPVTTISPLPRPTLPQPLNAGAPLPVSARATTPAPTPSVRSAATRPKTGDPFAVRAAPIAHSSLPRPTLHHKRKSISEHSVATSCEFFFNT